MISDLSNKVVWITGCSSGIGRVLALEFARHGASVVATCLGGPGGTEGLESQLSEWSNSSMVLEQDVTKASDAESVAKIISSLKKEAVVLINNAGIYPRVSAEKMTDEHWRALLSVNLDGAWYSCRAVMPLMKAAGYGKMIQVGSIAAAIGMENLVHYHASKMGLIGMTRGLARDLGRYGIRTNCVVLGAICVEAETELEGADDIDALVNSRQCVPGRLYPSDVAPIFLFLASAASDAITGQTITVDAGWTHL